MLDLCWSLLSLHQYYFSELREEPWKGTAITCLSTGALWFVFSSRHEQKEGFVIQPGQAVINTLFSSSLNWSPHFLTIYPTQVKTTALQLHWNVRLFLLSQRKGEQMRKLLEKLTVKNLYWITIIRIFHLLMTEAFSNNVLKYLSTKFTKSVL